MTWKSTWNRLRDALPWGRHHDPAVEIRTLPADAESAVAEHVLRPPISVYEGQLEYVIDVDIPGAVADSVQLFYDTGRLQLTAAVSREMKALRAPINEGVVWQRRISLPKAATNTASASLRNGVLSIRVSKRDTGSRQISVSSA